MRSEGPEICGTESGTWQTLSKSSILCNIIQGSLHCPLGSSPWPTASWYSLPDTLVHAWESGISEVFKTWRPPILLKKYILLKYSWLIISSVHQSDSVIHIYKYNFFHFLSHCGLSQDSEYSSLCYPVGPCLCFLYVMVCIC